MNNFFSRLKKIKHFEWFLAGGAILVMLLIYLTTLGNNFKSNSSSNVDYSKLSSNDKITYKIKETLCAIDGVGNCIVYLSWDNAVTTSSNTITNSDKGVKVTSAVVVCEGGSKGNIIALIKTTVSMLVNISPDKVLVYPMKKNTKKSICRIMTKCYNFL